MGDIAPAGRRSIPVSLAFEAFAHGAQFRDRIAVRAQAPPEAIFRAAREVTLGDMRLARLLGELRYLPARLAGRLPERDTTRPFFSLLTEGGTLLLRDDTPREIITGSAGRLHRLVDQAPVRFEDREAFEAFTDPDHEKLLMSLRVVPTGRPGEHWLVLEHATRALSAEAERKFRRYWHVIRPAGAFVTLQLLRAIRRHAQAAGAPIPEPVSVFPGRSVRATRAERVRPLPGDTLIPNPRGSLTHAVAIGCAPHDVWPWLAQMGAGSRAGWYSYDALDNGRRPSATRVVPQLQELAVGMLFPALPGATDGFTLLAFEPERFLTLGWRAPDGTVLVTWTFVLEKEGEGRTRLLVRARGGQGYQFHRLPWWVGQPVVRAIHFVMERRQLLGIAERAERLRRAPVPAGIRTHALAR